MATLAFKINVFHQGDFVNSVVVRGKVEVGRQRASEPEPCRIQTGPEGDRLIIAERNEATVARRHLELEPIDENRIRVTSRTANGTTHLLNPDRSIECDQSHELSIPSTIIVGVKRLVVMSCDASTEEEFVPLDSEPTVPGQPSDSAPLMSSLMTISQGGTQSPSLVLSWLKSAMNVIQPNLNAADMLPEAASALLQTVSLDTAAVLRWSDSVWSTEVVRGKTVYSENWSPSTRILQHVLDSKLTYRYQPRQEDEVTDSIRDVTALVASPIFGGEGQVIGALYGDRRGSIRDGMPAEISESEAMMVELLACGVAAGLERQRQEQLASTLGQFFPAALARRLRNQQDLLNGRQADVSILFCDIRNFSRISRRLGPEASVGWISDVMGDLSESVLEQEGVLVDYVGDELMAMWGAPDEQPDHANRACRAAMSMLRRLPGINDKWKDTLKEPFAVGIGINTGPAHVGNVGTRRRFKYGPLGNTVNLASRVQGATKFVKTPLLITEATAKLCGDGFPMRRVAKVKVHNIGDAVDLYELHSDIPPGWQQLKQEFEAALGQFEKNHCHEAAAILGKLLVDHPQDGPTIQLLSRAVNTIVNEPESFDPVWVLSGK